jgi:hypothetical protein
MSYAYNSIPINNAGSALYSIGGGGGGGNVTVLSTYPPANSADTTNATSFGLSTRIYNLANTANTAAASASTLAGAAFPTANFLNITASPYTATSTSTTATYCGNAINNLMSTVLTNGTNGSGALVTLAASTAPTSTVTNNTYDANSIKNLYTYITSSSFQSANFLNITASPYTATSTSTSVTYCANAINNLMTTVLTNGTNGSGALVTLAASTAPTSTVTNNTYDANSIKNLYNYLIASNGPILGNVGGVTISNGLTVSAGGLTLSAGGITMPGAWALAATAASNTILNIAGSANSQTINIGGGTNTGTINIAGGTSSTGNLYIGQYTQSITLGTGQATSGLINIGTLANTTLSCAGTTVGFQSQTISFGITQTSGGTIQLGNNATPANTTLTFYGNSTFSSATTFTNMLNLTTTSIAFKPTQTITMIGTTYNTSAFTGYPMSAIIALSGETSTLTASSSVAATYFRVPFQMKILGFRASLVTVDTGSATSIGISTNGQTGAAGFTWSSGTNLLNADLSIATNASSTMTSGGAGSLTATTANLTLTDDTVIGFFIKSCGSIGKGLKCTLYYVYA